jgi:hypothetical protein
VSRDAAGLVYAWPGQGVAGTHPIDALGRPVIGRDVWNKATLASDARRVLAGANASTPGNTDLPPLSPDLILGLPGLFPTR